MAFGHLTLNTQDTCVLINGEDQDRVGGVRYAQGFLTPGKNFGIWLLAENGDILASFNPSGLSQPQGEKHAISPLEDIVGYYSTSVEMDLMNSKERSSMGMPNSNMLAKSATAVTSFGLVVMERQIIVPLAED